MTEALPNWPRLLSVDLAAKYLGLGETGFLAGVGRGDWPEAVRLGRRRVWDRLLLDERADQLSGRSAGDHGNEWVRSLENVNA